MALSMTQKILLVLEHVPVPYVPQAAQVLDAILAEVHQMHVDAIATGAAPPTIDGLRATVADALAAAQEPWQRIKDREDVRGPIVTGSTGD